MSTLWQAPGVTSCSHEPHDQASSARQSCWWDNDSLVLNILNSVFVWKQTRCIYNDQKRGLDQFLQVIPTETWLHQAEWNSCSWKGSRNIYPSCTKCAELQPWAYKHLFSCKYCLIRYKPCRFFRIEWDLNGAHLHFRPPLWLFWWVPEIIMW